MMYSGAQERRSGELIPAGPELMATYEVRRIPLRQNLEPLVRDGLIVREQGRGSFVARPTLEKGMLRFFSFTEHSPVRADTKDGRVGSRARAR
jgi:GntR family transcriptional regulator